jgi:uncharacterized protein YcbK (DUF882 family)
MDPVSFSKPAQDDSPKQNKMRMTFFIAAFFFFAINTKANALLALPHDGTIRVFNYHLKEFAEIRYLDESGRWIPQARVKLNHILRSRGDDKTTSMDERLIELADHLQDHFHADTVEVISGYRSPSFNHALKLAGRDVANESLHTQGLALDIHLDEIKESVLRDYLLSLKLGGVGYYGGLLMVHMDFGPVRTWNGGDYRDNTEIGEFNKASSFLVRTQHLTYALNSPVNFSISGLSHGDLTMRIEKFVRGEWQDLRLLNSKEIESRSLSLKTEGKFRLEIKRGSETQYSNEFYLRQ